MSILEILLYFVLYCVGLFTAGYVYSEIWSHRLNKGKFKAGFDDILKGSNIMTRIKKIESKFEDPEFAKGIGRSIWESTRAEKGGTMRAIYADEKKMLAELGDLGSFEYPNLLKAAKEMQSMIDHEMIKPEWGETFLKWSSFPRAQPYLEKVAGKLFEKLDEENGGNSSYGSGGSDRLWV